MALQDLNERLYRLARVLEQCLESQGKFRPNDSAELVEEMWQKALSNVKIAYVNIADDEMNLI